METIIYKSCSKCGVDKSLNDFYQNLTAKSGYNSVCKVCYRERSKERSKKNFRCFDLIKRAFEKKNGKKKLHIRSCYNAHLKKREEVFL